VWTGMSFAIMASVSLMLAALRPQSPILASALSAPLIAVGLYQRAMHSALKAMPLAGTDPPTALGAPRELHRPRQRHNDPAAARALYPVHASDRSELVRVADIALYWAKGEGKNRVRIYQADAPALAELRQLADGRDRGARLKAAASLSLAVDARDAYVGGHS